MGLFINMSLMLQHPGKGGASSLTATCYIIYYIYITYIIQRRVAQCYVHGSQGPPGMGADKETLGADKETLGASYFHRFMPLITIL